MTIILSINPSLMKKFGWKEGYLLLVNNPWCPIWMSDAHRPENGDRDTQSTLPKLHILGFTGLDRFLERFWDGLLWKRHSHSMKTI
jgi:hypothetical protein